MVVAAANQGMVKESGFSSFWVLAASMINYPENRSFDLYPSPSYSSPTRGEESGREGMDIFLLRGAGRKPEWKITWK
jgi:hypothetical protein